jgi:hypothetical protein
LVKNVRSFNSTRPPSVDAQVWMVRGGPPSLHHCDTSSAGGLAAKRSARRMGLTGDDS